MNSEDSIQKTKRTYVRKPKVVEPVIEEPIVVEPPILTRSTNIEQLNNDLPIKRKYVRKVKSEPEVIPEPEPSKPDTPEPEPQQQTEKKPRSEKQIAAFNRMREARLKKQQELEGLKQFAKEKELFEKENSKVLKLEEKIIKKASSKKRVRKQTEYSDEYEEPCVHQVQTHKNILFV